MGQIPEHDRGRMSIGLGTIFLIVVIDLLGFGLIIPLLPFYATRFGASPLKVTLLFSVFSICQFVAAPVLGLISDRWGRKPVLVFSQLGSVAGYVLLGWASIHHWQNLTLGLWTIYLSRIIDGISGGNISTAQAYIADVTTARDRAKGMGMLGAAFGIGFSIGPAMGGLLTRLMGPAAPAFAAAGMSLLAAMLSAAKLAEARPVAEVESVAWLHPRRFMPVLRNPLLVQLNLVWFVAMAAFVMMDSAIALFLKDVFSFGELGLGWYFLFVGAIIVLVQGGVVGRLSRRLGERALCAVGLLTVAGGCLVTAGAAWWPLLAILMAGGAIHAVGRSLFQPSISALVSRNSDEDMQGASLGLYQGIGTLGRVVGPIIAGMVYARHLTLPWLLGSVLLLGTGMWMVVLHVPAHQVAEAAPEEA